MKSGLLGRVALGFAATAALAAGGRIAWVDAQSVGPGGVPGAPVQSFVCNAANNCAALNAANTFGANQTIAGGYGSALTFSYGDTSLEATTGAYASLGFFSGGNWLGVVTNSPEPGFQVPQNHCYGWGGGTNTAGNTFLCQTAANVASFGNAATGGSGWLELSAIGNGASGNTDLRGHLTLASGTASYTFAETYTVAPTCVATDTTAQEPAEATTTTTTLTLHGTGSDVLNYMCAD